MTAHDSVYIRQGRGIENKKRIVAFYKIVPVLHQSVFNGLKVRCCCGAIINDHYYFFVAAHRVTGDKRGLYAGSECSSRFLALSGEEPLPLFDLAGKSGSKWLNSFAPLNRELYIAINLLVSSWGGWLNPAARPVRYLSWLKNHPVLEVPGDIVDGVALLLRKDREGRTLLKIIEELRERKTLVCPDTS